MSFILDALKKSEAERRQGEVPKLQNEPYSPPPRRRPLWPLLLALALLLNGVILGWWLFAGDDASAPPVEVASPASHAALPEPRPPATAAPPRTLDPAPAAEPEVVTEVIEEVPVRPAAPTAKPAPAKIVEKKSPVRPAKAPPSTAVKPKVAAVAAAAESFPTVAELPGNVRSSLPRLDLQLHFFTPDPERRLVRLNGVNLREGGSSGDGLSVVEITADGVRLAYSGNRFFLPTGRP